MSQDRREPARDGGAAEGHQELLARLLGDIAAGRYQAGERLPPEMELAREFDVSRGAIRELLRSVEDRGVISIQRGRGTWIRSTSDWNVLDTDVLAALMPTPASIAVLAHYLECRRMLETEGAALAASRASSQHLSDMADALARMSDLAIGSQTDEEANRRFHETDIAFHTAIFRASANQVLPRVVEPIQNAMLILRPPLALHPEERVRKTLPEHKAILGAIADHEAEQARAAMTAHLSTVEGYLEEYRAQMEAKGRAGPPVTDP